MFFNYLSQLCGFGIYDKIIVFDFRDIMKEDYLAKASLEFGYKILFYIDIEAFRYAYETEIKDSKARHIVILKSDIYLPFDIRKSFYCKDINYKELFPKFNTFALESSYIFDLDLLYIAHENLFETLVSEQETKLFLLNNVFEHKNVKEFREYIVQEIEELMDKGGYSAWQNIALLYGKLKYLEYRCNNPSNEFQEMGQIIEKNFRNFVLSNYNSLSGYSAYKGPVLLHKGLDYIFMNSKKPALIVMDGMSVIDWLIIVENIEGIAYKFNSIYAIIPTITSISRQSLLSGRLPIEIENPFSLTMEKNLFINKCLESGYKEEEIKYHRGYDLDINLLDKCICIVINDIDDLVHSQNQGDMGMYNDVNLMAKGGSLSRLIKKLVNEGFDVFITSDHGHVETETIGTPKGTGVELETKSKRTLILKDFADYEKMIDTFDMIDYPPYFLPKEYKYLLCEYDKSFGIKGNTSVSHGGISIEEVIVPFIKVEGVK